MTENQMFPMSADIFDNSSNSSNPLKYDLYSSLGLSNSSSPNTIFATYSPTHQLSGTMNSLNNCQHTNVSSNVMLTNAISIPRSNNPNQCHKNYSTDDIMQHHHHQTSPSPLQQQMMAAQQNQQQQPLHIQTSGILAELSDYGLDALESSLSPTLLQDVSLNSTSPLHSININGNLSVSLVSDNNNSYYAQSGNAASPPMGIALDMGQLSNSGDSIGSVTPDGVNCMLLSGLNTAAAATTGNNNAVGHDDDEGNNTMMYNVLDDGNNNSTHLWNDISCSITTKNEPFSIDDDFIFHTDKSELQAAGFGELTDDNFLQVMGNIDDYLKTTIATSTNEEDNCLSNDLYNNAHSQLNGSEQQQQQQISPVNQLPLNLLEQHQQQQQICQQQQDNYAQLQTLATQQQQLQQTKAMLQLQNNTNNNNGSAGGAIHHTHSRHSSSSPYEIYHSTPNKLQQQHLNSNTFSPGSQPSQSPLQLNSITPPPHANRLHYQQNMVKSRNMQELLKKGFSMSPDHNMLGQSVPNSQIIISGIALSPSGSGSSGFGSATTRSSNSNSAKKSLAYHNDNSISRLSSSAPTHLGFDHIWTRREPRQHLLSTGSLAEAESVSSLSTGSVLSPDGIDFSQDDDDDDGTTDYNSDNYDDFSSDNGSYNEDDGRTVSMQRMSSGKGKERYFWQYNVQAKGPKGKRLVFQSKLEDPHVLNEATDPVFSPNCSVRGIKVFKHSGKARKGDGNDLTPNARKLQSIGRELDKLNRTINDMTPVSELPFNVRPKSRKEKNKLASRACRLKKKAQHEANKIKLFGLELEHKRLLTGIAEIKQALALKYSNQHAMDLQNEIDKQIEYIYRTAKTGVNIAGTTTEFVNKVLENVKSGIPNGGLDELKNS